MKPLFYFEYNIPSEYVTGNQPDKFVLVRVTDLKENGVYAEFVDLNHSLVVKVRDWLKVWEGAQIRADEKAKEYKNNAKPLFSFNLTEDHAVQLTGLS